MAEDDFKTHQLDGPSLGDEPQTQVPEENPLVNGRAHVYDPHNEPSPNEAYEAEFGAPAVADEPEADEPEADEDTHDEEESE